MARFRQASPDRVAHEDALWVDYGLSFANNLRLARRGRKLTQQALADLAGLSRNQVVNLERGGTSDPMLSTVYKLALALEVPPATLLPGVARLVGVLSALSEDGEGADTEEDVALIVRPEDVRPFPEGYVEQRRIDAGLIF